MSQIGPGAISVAVVLDRVMRADGGQSDHARNRAVQITSHATD